MKPFNLEAALRGEKVVTKNGREVKQLTKFEGVTEWAIGHFCLAGVMVDGLGCSIKTWSIDGVYGQMQDDFQEFQLFMAEEE